MRRTRGNHVLGLFPCAGDSQWASTHLWTDEKMRMSAGLARITWDEWLQGMREGEGLSGCQNYVSSCKGNAVIFIYSKTLMLPKSSKWVSTNRTKFQTTFLPLSWVWPLQKEERWLSHGPSAATPQRCMRWRPWRQEILEGNTPKCFLLDVGFTNDVFLKISFVLFIVSNFL